MVKTTTLEAINYIGKVVKIYGWVNSRRNHGNLIFIDLRDRDGLIQVVFKPLEGKRGKNFYELANKLRQEWVISVSGIVSRRSDKTINPNLKTGNIEILAQNIEILNKSKIPVFEIGDAKTRNKISEKKRMEYRYLDLRRKRMKENIILRHKVIKSIRDFFDKKGFLEIETPILTKSTPEGARDYIVPSRLQLGKFYALPQSPQQYKQLLMVAGFEKYFQIARCFRDEDLRGDRQPEFTQLDVEISFCDRQDVMKIIEELMKSIASLANKKLTFNPFKVITYKEAIKKYKTDKPDLRKNKKDPNELCFVWVIDWPMFEWNKEEKRWDPMHHIFTRPKEEDINLLDKEPSKVMSWQYDLVCNGHEIGGGSLRNYKASLQEKIFKLVGLDKKQIKEKFGHLLRAFEYGAPPHGGIAIGIDRLLMILRNETSIREVIAFPKTGDGRDLLMGAPSEVEKKQLKELSIKIEK